MATLHISLISGQKKTLSEYAAVKEYLAGVHIDYEIWKPATQLASSATSHDILQAFAKEIAHWKQQGGYVTADVIDLHPDTANLEGMLARFRQEHWHDEDEVRFIVEGHGVFHIHSPGAPVIALEVAAGDLARIPAGTWHWFDLCKDRRIRAIRLFQEAAGWTPHYTQSGVDKGYQPLCLGPAFIPPETP